VDSDLLGYEPGVETIAADAVELCGTPSAKAVPPGIQDLQDLLLTAAGIEKGRGAEFEQPGDLLAGTGPEPFFTITTFHEHP
jgi:hypothetical protein